MEQHVDIEAITENIACPGKTISLCYKQHLSNIWGPIYQKVK